MVDAGAFEMDEEQERGLRLLLLDGTSTLR